MSSVNGSYQDISATVVAADGKFDTWIAALDARLQDLSGGDTCTRGRGSLTINVTAENGAGEEFIHRIVTTWDTGVTTAGHPDADWVTVMTALSTYAAAVVAASEYDDVNQVEIRASITLSD